MITLVPVFVVLFVISCSLLGLFSAPATFVSGFAESGLVCGAEFVWFNYWFDILSWLLFCPYSCFKLERSNPGFSSTASNDGTALRDSKNAAGRLISSLFSPFESFRVGTRLALLGFHLLNQHFLDAKAVPKLNSRAFLSALTKTGADISPFGAVICKPITTSLFCRHFVLEQWWGGTRSLIS